MSQKWKKVPLEQSLGKSNAEMDGTLRIFEKMNQKFELRSLVSNDLEVGVTWWKTISFTIFFPRAQCRFGSNSGSPGDWETKSDENPLVLKNKSLPVGPGSGIQTFKRQVRCFSDLKCSPLLIILSYLMRTHHPNPKRCWKWERHFEWA